ncbi:MAG: type II toxin-antitoxin system HicB family antitoxin [Emergencia sp.]|nr:type II toxin-antitoxin system HicB family antitoxin [Emergencia sp.]
MAKDRYCYPAVFGYDPTESEISVVFPDLNCATSGTTDEEALACAKELLGCVLFGLEEDGEEIPLPTHLSEVEAAANERTALVEVFMPAVRMAQNNRSVNRTVTLPAWLNAAGQEHGMNFSQLLQEAIKTQLGMEK